MKNFTPDDFKQFSENFTEDHSDEELSQKTAAAIKKIIADYGNVMTVGEMGRIRYILRLSNGTKREFLNFFENFESELNSGDENSQKSTTKQQLRKNITGVNKYSPNLFCCCYTYKEGKLSKVEKLLQKSHNQLEKLLQDSLRQEEMFLEEENSCKEERAYEEKRRLLEEKLRQEERPLKPKIRQDKLRLMANAPKNKSHQEERSYEEERLRQEEKLRLEEKLRQEESVRQERLRQEKLNKEEKSPEKRFRELYDYVDNLDPNPFRTAVEKLKKQKKMKSSDIYNPVDMSRQVYNNALSCENVTRKVVWKIIIGLKCNLDEAEVLLKAAGYLPWSKKMDRTIGKCLAKKVYNIVRIDLALYDEGLDSLQGPMGSVKNKRPKPKQKN